MMFPGQYYDQESGLHYNYFRDYDPRTGRYIEPDPVGLLGGPNVFNYDVGGNPTNRIDPTGEYGPAFVAAAEALELAGPVILDALGKAAAFGGSAAIFAYLTSEGVAENVIPGDIPMVSNPPEEKTPPVPIPLSPPRECKNDKQRNQCSKASTWQLKRAKIFDEHAFKDHWGAVPFAHFEICACKDGSIVIKAWGTCGRSGPSIPTPNRWK